MNRLADQAGGITAFRPVGLDQPKLFARANTGYPNSDIHQSISVYGLYGSDQSGALAELTLDHYAAGQIVEVVRIPLHHGRTLRQVLRFVVHASDARLLVR